MTYEQLVQVANAGCRVASMMADVGKAASAIAPWLPTDARITLSKSVTTTTCRVTVGNRSVLRFHLSGEPIIGI